MNSRSFFGVRALGAAALVCLAALLWAVGPVLVLLYNSGNILGTNSVSGITLEDASSMIGRVEFALLAGGTVLLHDGLLGRSRAGSRAAGWLARRPAVWFTIVAAFIGVLSLLCCYAVHRGKLTFHLDDDAMISMRYARNLARGQGLVYNPGEHVEGYTNFLWTILMAVAHLVLPDRLASGGVLVLNAGCVVAIIWLVQSLLRGYGVRGPIAIAIAGFTLALDVNDVFWCLAGLEAVGIALLVVACAWGLLRNKRAVFLVSLSLIPLMRSDGALLAVLLGGIYLVTASDRRRALQGLALATLPGIAQILFRLGYYGHLLPNTYYLKMIGLADRVVIGIGGYGFRFLIQYALFAPVLVYLAAGKRFDLRLRLLAVVVFVQIAYAIYVGGDTFWQMRFFTPVVPLLYFLVAYGLDRMLRRSTRAVATVLALMLGVCAPFSIRHARLGSTDRLGPTSTEAFDHEMRNADLLTENVPPGGSVTIYPAGMVPYFAPTLRFVDVLGKTDEHIAHQREYHGVVIGHNKFDFDYVYRVRRPDVAFAAFTCNSVRDWLRFSPEERARRISEQSPESFVAPLWEANNTTFMTDYAPRQVTMDDGRDPDLLGCLFVRPGSTVPLRWHYPPAE